MEEAKTVNVTEVFENFTLLPEKDVLKKRDKKHKVVDKCEVSRLPPINFLSELAEKMEARKKALE